MDKQELSIYDNAKHWVAQYESVDNLLKLKDYADQAENAGDTAKNDGDDEAAHKAYVASVWAQRQMGKIINDENNRRKDIVRSARKDFKPGKREPCKVCGKYKSIAHAHHVTPLSKQAAYVQRADEVDHTHVWLCPNHHAAVHLLLNFSDRQKKDENAQIGRSLDWFSELNTEEIRRIVDIAHSRASLAKAKMMANNKFGMARSSYHFD